MSAWDGKLPLGSRGKLHVHVKRRGGDVLNWPTDAVHCPGDDADPDPIFFISGNRGGRHFLIARLGHFEVRGEVDPQLKTIDRSVLAAPGHLLMQDTATGTHPLHIAGADQTLVAEAVAMSRG